MRIPLFILPLCLLGCSTVKPDSNGPAQALLALEREAIDREFRNDTAFLSSLMDPTFIELSGDTLKNRHEVLRAIYADNLNNRDNRITLDSFALENPVVHNYGSSAVVTFILHTYRKREGVPFERRTRFYDVWVRRGNGWKAVTWQATPLTGK